VQSFVDAGADIITFHVESTRHPHRVLQSLAGTGVVRGVALNPGTSLEAVKPLLDELELIFLLAINPGWGGQKFLPSTERRLAEARELIGDREILLEVDGGITKSNIEHVATLGANLVVSGSAIYDGVAPLDNARYMLEAVRNAPRTGPS
jgi:ribulose-phosphate 3-epimerase